MNTNTSTSTHIAVEAAPFAGRVLLAAIFLISGAGKLAAPEGTIAYIVSVGIPAPTVAYVLALLIELGAGGMLLAGFHTRLAAAVLAVFSIASALIFHHALSDQNQLFHFLKNFAIAGGLLQVISFGAGSCSIDSFLVAIRGRAQHYSALP